MFYSTIFLYLCLFSYAHAQFIQRWTWQNVQDPPGTGPYVPTPFWHRESTKPLRKVLIPESDIVLEYNCHKMPAICQNIRNWEADASKSQWLGRQVGWFTFDMGHSNTQRYPGFSGLKSRSYIRREMQCPKNSWAGTTTNPRCPEPNQPDVVPFWFNGLTGQSITDIVPQDTSKPAALADLEIMYWSSNPQYPNLSRRRSGRVYSCDEFPPGKAESRMRFRVPELTSASNFHRGWHWNSWVSFSGSDANIIPLRPGKAEKPRGRWQQRYNILRTSWT